MKISIVIPNYNGFDLLQKNLPKVISAMDTDLEVKIIIVDDCSSPVEQENLNKLVSVLDSKIPIKLIKHTKNKGFALTVNTGAFHDPADFYVFLNTDVVPENGFLDKAIKHFENNENLFGVGFMDESIEGNHKVLRGRGIGEWKKGMLIHSRGEVDKSNTLWISGGSSVIRGSMFRSLKGFDSLYSPFYWEDIDLSFRAQKRGYALLFDSSIKVKHFHDEGSIKKHFSKNKILSIAYRNQFIFHWKNISDISFLFSHLFWLPYHVFRALIRFDIPFFVGFVKVIGMLPIIISTRGDMRVITTDHRIINQKW